MTDLRRAAFLLLTAAVSLHGCDAPPDQSHLATEQADIASPDDHARRLTVPEPEAPAWKVSPATPTPPEPTQPAQTGTQTEARAPDVLPPSSGIDDADGATAVELAPPSARVIDPVRPHPTAPASFADLVEKVQPAVVNIYTEQVVSRQHVRIDPIYGPYAVTRPERATSLGSGFLVDAEGYILTNTHVIKGAQAIKISISDGREFPATVVGTDPMTDIALIRIEPFAGMQFLELGDADNVRVGDWLMAVGNPFGLQSTVTVGILSARGRRNVPISGDIRYIDFLQTDASINPGNSGGPLIAMDGSVIGINTAINAEGQGIGFAVPINMARSILHELRSAGSVSRSWIGVQLRPMPSTADGRKPTGALVADVVVQGPAAQAGLQAGDIILRFGEHVIHSHEDLPWLASNAGVGERVDVVVQRDGQQYLVPITMGALPN